MSISTASSTIFSRVIAPERGTLTPEVARVLLDMNFPPQDHARYEQLSAKAQEGTLTKDEADELDGYLHVDSLLAIMRLKARRSLGQ